MGKKNVVMISLAICLLLSSFPEVSCKVDENKDSNPFDDAELQLIKLEDFSDVDNSVQPEGVSGHEGFRGSHTISTMSATKEEDITKTTKKKNKVETCETKSEVESGKDEADQNRICCGKKDEKQSATMESIESSKTSNSGLRVIGSRGIGQTGVWRCFNQEKNGVREDEEFPIVLTEYNVDDIIKEESTYEGSASNTSSLIASLIALVEKHKPETLFQTRRKLRATLKRYRNTTVSELVTRSDFEQILTMAARFEELISASVSYIARLSMYASVIKKGPKASQRVQLAQQRATLLLEMANEKQKRVDAELKLAKAYARKGDMLHVKIFAMKKAMVKFEAKKEEIEMSLQKIVANLTILIDEAAQAYEEHHVAELKWKEEVKPSMEYSYDDIESAGSAWASFVNSL